MWRSLRDVFKTRQEVPAQIRADAFGLQKISANELAAFCWCASDRLMML